MKNKQLADDYIERAGHRMAALEVLLQRQSHADVVREAQEIIELCLKAVLRRSGIEIPRIHDVGEILIAEEEKLPLDLKPHTRQLAAYSKDLRRDRELAYYGTEDLTPSEFYKEEDSQKAFKAAEETYQLCRSALDSVG